MDDYIKILFIVITLVICAFTLINYDSINSILFVFITLVGLNYFVVYQY